MAVNAGVDMHAICADANAIRDGYRAVLHAVQNNEISEERLNETVKRILHLKGHLCAPPAFDATRLTQLADKVAAFNAELGN